MIAHHWKESSFRHRLFHASLTHPPGGIRIYSATNHTCTRTGRHGFGLGDPLLLRAVRQPITARNTPTRLCGIGAARRDSHLLVEARSGTFQPAWCRPSLNSVSSFSLFSQLKKWMQAAEQPISCAEKYQLPVTWYFSALIGYRVLARTGNKHENTI